VGHGHRLALSDGRECGSIDLLDRLLLSLAGPLQRIAAEPIPELMAALAAIGTFALNQLMPIQIG